jgi:hypothetical protein
MNYRITDAPDSTIVDLKLTIGQLKILDKLVDYELADAERGESSYEEEPLQRLVDKFWQHLHIPLTEEEQRARWTELRRKWANEELKALEGL